MPEAIREATARARRLWRLVLFVPIVYLGIAFLVNRLFFEPNLRTGLLNATSYEMQRSVVVAGAIILIVLAPAVILLRGWFVRRLESYTPRIDGERAAAALIASRYFLLPMIADFAALLGLTVFLATGEWRGFILGGGAAYVLYLQVYPGEGFLPECWRVGG